jgi:predicted AAA+ superfamily ATPase
VFESWVVAEILKARANLGISDPVWFYRDQSGNEVDLVVETGDRLLLVEIKSGERVASDAIESMRTMVATFGETKRKVQGMIVYGGDTAASVHGIDLVPWRELGAQTFC